MTMVDTVSRSEGSGPAAFEQAGRRTADAAGVDASAVTRARLTLVRGIPVVRVIGELDRYALRAVRVALDQALATSPTGVVVDLSGTQRATSLTIAFLSCMRRYLHARSSGLVLVGAPAGLLEAMNRTHVLPLYAVEATRNEAVAVLRTRAANRTCAGVEAPSRTDGNLRRGRSPRPGCDVGCPDCLGRGARL